VGTTSLRNNDGSNSSESKGNLEVTKSTADMRPAGSSEAVDGVIEDRVVEAEVHCSSISITSGLSSSADSLTDVSLFKHQCALIVEKLFRIEC